MLFILVLLLATDPRPVFAVMAEYHTMFDCNKALEKAPKDDRPKMACMAIVTGGQKEAMNVDDALKAD